MSFLSELRRRNVVRMAALYIVAAWLVMQVAEVVIGLADLPDWAGPAVLVVLAVGFPLALLCAWLLELTPGGVALDGQARQDRAAGTDDRRAEYVLIAMLCAAVLLFAYDKWWPDVARPRSIAVLPFENLSGDPGQEYLASGMTEELLNRLAAVPDVRVTSRSSVFAYRDSGMPLPDIARELGVGYVLEGSIRQAGNRLRITAQLIEAETDTHAWSATYDRDMDDILAIQDDIAAAILPALELKLSGAASSSDGVDPEAYVLYLQALHFYLQRTAAGLERAVDHALRSLDLDTEHAPSWVLLGSAYINQANTGQRPFVEAFELAYDAVEQALALDPDYALGHSARAWIAMAYERDYAAAARHFARARELMPGSSTVLANSAVLATRLGRLETASRLSDAAARLDPASSVIYANWADQLMRSGRYPEARQAATTALELSPGSSSPLATLAQLQILDGQPSFAVATAEGLDDAPARLLVLAMACHDLGDRAASGRSLAALKRDHAQDRAYYVAVGYAWRGEADPAFEWLDRAVSEGQSVFGITTDPFLRSLHDDPRWQPLVRRIGLAEDQVGHIRLDAPRP